MKPAAVPLAPSTRAAAGDFPLCIPASGHVPDPDVDIDRDELAEIANRAAYDRDRALAALREVVTDYNETYEATGDDAWSATYQIHQSTIVECQRVLHDFVGTHTPPAKDRERYREALQDVRTYLAGAFDSFYPHGSLAGPPYLTCGEIVRDAIKKIDVALGESRAVAAKENT